MATIRGGEKFEAAMLDLAKKLNRKETLRVGFLEGATYPDGTPVAMIAAIQNYGAPKVGIPPRPFFSNMIADKSPAWPEAISNLLVKNNYDVEKTLTMTGEAIKGQLQDSIVNGAYAPLAQSTIDRKGFDKPLVDTSHMLNSVAYEIKS